MSLLSPRWVSIDSTIFCRVQSLQTCDTDVPGRFLKHFDLIVGQGHKHKTRLLWQGIEHVLTNPFRLPVAFVDGRTDYDRRRCSSDNMPLILKRFWHPASQIALNHPQQFRQDSISEVHWTNGSCLPSWIFVHINKRSADGIHGQKTCH